MNTRTRFYSLIPHIIAASSAMLLMLTATSAAAQSDPCLDESTRELEWRDTGLMHCDRRSSSHVQHPPTHVSPIDINIDGGLIATGALGALGGLVGIVAGGVLGVVVAENLGPDPLGVSAGFVFLGAAGGGYAGGAAGLLVGESLFRTPRAPAGVAQPKGIGLELSF